MPYPFQSSQGQQSGTFLSGLIARGVQAKQQKFINRMTRREDRRTQGNYDAMDGFRRHLETLSQSGDPLTSHQAMSMLGQMHGVQFTPRFFERTNGGVVSEGITWTGNQQLGRSLPDFTRDPRGLPEGPQSFVQSGGGQQYERPMRFDGREPQTMAEFMMMMNGDGNVREY